MSRSVRSLPVLAPPSLNTTVNTERVCSNYCISWSSSGSAPTVANSTLQCSTTRIQTGKQRHGYKTRKTCNVTFNIQTSRYNIIVVYLQSFSKAGLDIEMDKSARIVFTESIFTVFQIMSSECSGNMVFWIANSFFAEKSDLVICVQRENNCQDFQDASS